MALVEQIEQMKQQGLSEDQIMTSLKEQNFSPVQIQEALSQSQVKSAVAPEQTAQPISGEQGMQPSIMQQGSEQTKAPMQEQPQEAQYTEQPAYDQASSAEQQGYADQGYGYPQQDAYYQQGIDAETIRDITKTILEEELDKIKTQLSEVLKLKTDLGFDVQNIDTRLKKIENTMDELQRAIIKKIGSYGESINEISSELQATQQSFSKLVNPLIDQKRQSAPSTPTKSRKTKKTASKRGSKSSESFEDYFR